MAINDKQKIVLVDISANTQNLIEQKLEIGYVIIFIVNLQPSVNKLLIVYVTPDII
jgi:hypothetical protein